MTTKKVETVTPFFCEDLSFFSLKGKDAIGFLSSLCTANLNISKQSSKLAVVLTAKAKVKFVFYVHLCGDEVIILMQRNEIELALQYFRTMHFSEQLEIPQLSTALLQRNKVFAFPERGTNSKISISSIKCIYKGEILPGASFLFAVTGVSKHYPLYFLLYNSCKEITASSIKKETSVQPMFDGKSWLSYSCEASFPLLPFLSVKDISIVEQPLLVGAVARGKGCYPGQEVVERLIAQGKTAAHFYIGLLCNMSIEEFYSIIDPFLDLKIGLESVSKAALLSETETQQKLIFFGNKVAQEELKTSFFTTNAELLAVVDTKKENSKVVGRVFSAGVVAEKCVMMARVSSKYAYHGMEWMAKLRTENSVSTNNVGNDKRDENLNGLPLEKESFFTVQACGLPFVTATRHFTTDFSGFLEVALERGMEYFHLKNFLGVEEVITNVLREYFSLPNKKALENEELQEKVKNERNPSEIFVRCIELFAVCAEKLEQEKKAIAWNRIISEIAPQEVMPHTNLSRLYMKKGLIELAEKEKTKATMLSFRQEASRQRTKVSREQFELQKNAADEERIARFRKILSQFPEDEIALFALGKLYYDKKNYEQALYTLEKLATCNKMSSAGFMIFSKTLIALNKVEKAKQILRQGIVAAENTGDFMPLKAMQVDLDKIT